MNIFIIRLVGSYLNALSWIAPTKAGRLGFLFFCRPFRIPFNVKQNTYLNTAYKYVYEYGDLPVQVYRWGNGKKKVVFLHGWQSHTYRWKSYIEALSKQEYTIYSLDAPGHGLSGGNFLSVPVYSGLIQQFLTELGEVDTVIGHSLGSFSLVYTFYRNPLMQVNKVILMAPPGEASDFMAFYQHTLKLSKRAMNLIVNHFKITYEVGPEFFSATKFAEALKVQGLIIHDEGDDEAPYKYAQIIHKKWSRSILITTKGFGHNLRAISVVNHVVKFITGHDTHTKVAVGASLEVEN
jgi:esterase/lipase